MELGGWDFLENLVDQLETSNTVTAEKLLFLAAIALACSSIVVTTAIVGYRVRGLNRVIWVLTASVGYMILYDFFHTRCWAIVQDPCATPGECQHVDVRDNATASLLREYKALGKPLLMRGIAASEVAEGRFQPEQFAQHVDQNFTVTLNCGAVETSQTSLLHNINLKGFVGNLSQPNIFPHCARPYVTEVTSLTEALTVSMRANIDTIMKRAVSTDNDETLLFWWFGGVEDVRSGLHKDPDTLNVLHQLHGQKDVWVFPPEHTEFLYPGSKYDFGGVSSKVDVWDDAIEAKFPLFRHAKPLKVTVSAGDALYIPNGWMHYAQSKAGSSISVSGRSFTTCEQVSMIPTLVEAVVHQLHPRLVHSDCTCH